MSRALVIVALLALSGCSSWVDSARSGIYGWCQNTPDWCDVNAVKP